MENTVEYNTITVIDTLAHGPQQAEWSRPLLSSPSHVLSFARTSWHPADTQLDQLGIHRHFDSSLRSSAAAHGCEYLPIGHIGELSFTEILLQIHVLLLIRPNFPHQIPDDLVKWGGVGLDQGHFVEIS